MTHATDLETRARSLAVTVAFHKDNPVPIETLYSLGPIGITEFVRTLVSFADDNKVVDFAYEFDVNA